ncbi:hypothetical protein FB41_1634 [Cutibacterium acnes]|nr:hypothetical protein FB41_1634 [Cutibacterium acnes]
MLLEILLIVLNVSKINQRAAMRFEKLVSISHKACVLLE